MVGRKKERTPSERILMQKAKTTKLEKDPFEVLISNGEIKLPKNLDLDEYGILEGEALIAEINTDPDNPPTISLTPLSQDVIQSIRDVDVKIFEIEKEHIENLNIKGSKFPKTCLAAMSLIAGISSIKLGVLALCEQRELYSAKVLFRALLDHFLKLNYLFFRIGKDKNDNVGEDYIEYFPLAELALYGRSIDTMKRMLKLEYSGKTLYEILCDLRPELKDKSRGHLEKKVTQFTYKKIIEYILESTNSDDKIRNTLVSIIPDYSELSSFVHGGPSATKEIGAIWDHREVEIECAKLARSVFNLFILAKCLSLIIYSFANQKLILLPKRIMDVWIKIGKKIDEQIELVEIGKTSS